MGRMPDIIPDEAIYFNAVLFGSLAVVLLLGWKNSGAIMPKMDNMVPKGTLGKVRAQRVVK